MSDRPHLADLWHEERPAPMPYRLHWGWIALAIVGLLGVTLMQCEPVYADQSGAKFSRRAKSHSILLARIVAGEAGLTPGLDTAPIHAVLVDRARRMDVPYKTAARWYSRHLDRRRTDSRAWIAWLREDGRQPRHWPARLRWNRYRDGWLALLKQARRVVSGREMAPCMPEHFGDRHGDAARARALGWTQVDCGETRDSYWTVPRREVPAS